MRRTALASLLLAAPLALAAPTTSTGAAQATPTDRAGLRDAHGIEVLEATREGRLVRAVVSTEALARPVRVNVLLPRGYDEQRRRWPSYLLFHGTSGGAEDWLDMGDVRRATRNRDLVTVMPDAGYDSNGGSWFTDWVDQATPLGAANWEEFHVEQLVPWVDANFRTIRDRSGRAIAGLSQGGFGAFSYAARHPDLFAAAASFSGAVDIARHPVAKSSGSAAVSGIMTGLNGVQPYAPFGDPVLEDVVWQGHNPASLVDNLRSTDLRLWTGNGEPGPLDDPAAPNPAGTGIEQFTYRSTLFFAEAADAEEVPYELVDYGAGTHTWPYWARDLREWLPGLERLLESRPAAPRTVSYRSIERRWAQWGWHVAVDRDALHAWSGLAAADRRGFTLSGGPARVVTPAVHRPGTAYDVVHAGGSGPAAVVADRRGRLRLDVVPDGPGPVRVTLSPRR